MDLDKKIENELSNYSNFIENIVTLSNGRKEIYLNMNLIGKNKKTGNLGLIIHVKIVLTEKYPDIAPKVYDLLGLVKNMNNFHINPDNSLCLAHPIELYRKYNKNTTLNKFIEDFVIPYYYSLIYFIINKKMPFDEYSHGANGDIEAISNYFNISKKYNSNIEYIYYIFLYKKNDIISFLPEIEFNDIMDRLFSHYLVKIYYEIYELDIKKSIKLKNMLFNYLKIALFYKNLDRNKVESILRIKYPNSI